MQPSKTAISLRLPVSLLEQIKIAANKRDVPYQSLIKIFLRERMDMEHGKVFAVGDQSASYQAKKRKGS